MDPVQDRRGLLAVGVVLWALTWLTNRGVRAKKTGFRDIDHLEDEALPPTRRGAARRASGPPSTVGRVTRRPVGPAAGVAGRSARWAARRSPRPRRPRAPRRRRPPGAHDLGRHSGRPDAARGRLPSAARATGRRAGGPRAGRGLPVRLGPRLPQPGRRRPHRRRASQQFVDKRTGEVANSTNAEYDAALDHVIDEMASHGTDDVLVAGDLVEGRWGRDDARTGVFGPVRTQAQRLRAWRRAADVYYPAWRERFDDRGLTTYPALGDHEIGDDPWRAAQRDAWIDFKRRHVPEFKRIYADHMLTGERRPAPVRRPARRAGPPHGLRRAPRRRRPARHARRLRAPWRRRAHVRRPRAAALAQGRAPPGPQGRRAVGDGPGTRPDDRRRCASATPATSSTRRARAPTCGRRWSTAASTSTSAERCTTRRSTSATASSQVSHGSLFYRGEASYVARPGHRRPAGAGEPPVPRGDRVRATGSGPRRARARPVTSATPTRPSSPAPSSPAAPVREDCAWTTPRACSHRAAEDTRPACAASRVQGSVTVRARRCARRTLVE